MAKAKIESTPPDARAAGLETRELPCKLSDTELMERGEQLASSVELSEKIREQKRAALRGYNVELKAQEEIQTKLCKAIDTGAEPRNVSCQWHDSTEKPERFLTRTDTGEEIYRRALDPHELQQSMFAAVPTENVSGGDAENENDDDDFDDSAFGDDDDSDVAGDAAH